MWTGSETLATIDESLDQLRSQLHEVDQQVHGASQHLVELQQTTAQRFRDLAQFRLDRMHGEKVVAALDSVDQRVATLLAARDEQLRKLEQQVVDNQNRQKELERQRESQRQLVNEAIKALDAAQAKTQQRLLADPGYCERYEKAKQADAVAREAETKTEQAQHDRTHKGVPYEEDPLFMYLWRRGYGTSAYHANPLTRFLDGWVARLCSFHDARPNYYMLLEIPARLKEHAEQVRQIARDHFEPLKNEEQAAAEADGIPQLAAALHDAQKSLADVDARIKAAESDYRKLAEERAACLSGKDENFQQCLEATAFQLEREPVLSLRNHARATPSPRDDALVEQLGDFETRKTQFTAALDRYQQIHARHLSRVEELEEVRRRFKRQDYDDYGSAFSNKSMILAVLNEFLRGLASAEDLWGILRNNHRRQIESDPTFGSGGMRIPGGVFGIPIPRLPGGIGFPDGGWRIPTPPSGGPWYGPRIGGGSGGGGGGIGGGGFKTTGGF